VGVPNSGCVPSRRDESHVWIAKSSIVAGAFSARRTGAPAVAGPTPYSAVVAFQ